jgi:hypothetical protein
MRLIDRLRMVSIRRIDTERVMKINIRLRVCLFILIFGISPGLVTSAQDVLTIDTESFRLVRDQRDYTLRYDRDKRLRIRQAWLVPPDELKEESGAYISSFNYDEGITVFPIGDGRMGLHLSSYEIQTEGSADAAAGRDVLLVLDPKARRLHQGGLLYGVTKERVRFMGCFFATFHRFIIGDINNDRLIDVGVTREEIRWDEVRDREKGVDRIKGPFYERGPIRWYVFARHGFGKDHWNYEPDYDGKHPNRSLQLPLVGLARSPVDFVKELYRGKMMKRRTNIRGGRTMVLKYGRFGPQVLAHELIGFEWHQWNPCGHPDPRHIDDIRVVVYRDIGLEEVKRLYPVVKDLRQDYRHVHYDKALEYLDGHIREFEEDKKSDPKMEELYDSMISDFRDTRRQIVTILGP